MLTNVNKEFLGIYMPSLRLLIVALTSLWTSIAPGDETPPNAWSKSFTPPTKMDTKRVHLEPLQPRHAELDFNALMASKQHLRTTLRWGDWPADEMTVEANRKDLERHWKEFEDRKAYAYTVLTPERDRCVGCVYLYPAGKRPRFVRIAYWVVADELPNELDRHLVEAVLNWIEREWPFERAVLSLHTENVRGAKIAGQLGLRRGGPPSGDHVRFVWRRKDN